MEGDEFFCLGVGFSLAELGIQGPGESEETGYYPRLECHHFSETTLSSVSPETWFACHWPWAYKLGVSFMGRWHIESWVYKWPSEEASQVKGMNSRSHGLKKLSCNRCYFRWQANKNEQNPYFSECVRIIIHSRSDFS